MTSPEGPRFAWDTFDVAPRALVRNVVLTTVALTVVVLVHGAFVRQEMPVSALPRLAGTMFMLSLVFWGGITIAKLIMERFRGR